MKTILLIAAALLIGIHPVEAAGPKPVATLTISFGDVMMRPAGKADWKPVKRGMFFFQGDRIKSLEDGKAEVAFSDGSIVHIGNESELEFNPIEKDKQKKKSIFLVNGKLWNKVVKGTQFETESVHAVAAVKGTEYSTFVGEKMDIWVSEGIVEVFNEQGKVVAQPNTHTQVQKGVAPTKQIVPPTQLPRSPDLTPKISVTPTSPGPKTEGKPFEVKATLKDIEANKIFTKEALELTFSAAGDGLEISADGSQWGNSATAKTSEGAAKVFAKGKAGDHEIAITSAKTPGVALVFSIKADIKEKKLILEYLDSNQKTRTIEIELKRKE